MSDEENKMPEEEMEASAPEVEQTTEPEDTLADSPLLEDIIQSTNMKPKDEAYDLTMQGLQEMVKKLASSENEVNAVSKEVVDDMIAELDRQIGIQLDAVMHNREFQKLESSWRGLKFLVDRTDFRENTKIEFINVTKDDLLEDFEDSPEIVKSGLYKLIYTSEYGQFGGQPYGNLIGNFEFSTHPQDLKLLGHVSQIGAMAHAPFIASASPKMFGLGTYRGIPQLKDLSTIFEGPQYAKWRSLRESEDARYLALTLPRFLLRLPYGKETDPVKEFDYNENVYENHEDYLWGNTSFAFATRITESFAKYRWCTNIIGPKGGGAVEELPLHLFEDMGDIQTKIPTEVLLSERREFELAEEGFIGLTMRKGSDNAAFFSANSIQKPKKFPNTAEGMEAQTNYALSTQLPYMFVANRLAHYLKVIQRENIGLWKEAVDLENELNLWIRQYIADMDNPMPSVRSRRPLRQAQINVTRVEGEPGWYRVGIKVKPHFKYMGAYFTLSLVGKLDNE